MTLSYLLEQKAFCQQDKPLVLWQGGQWLTQERSQTHPHVETTMTSLGNFQPALYMIRGRGDYAELYITWCVLWYHWFGPSGISPSRGPTTTSLSPVSTSPFYRPASSITQASLFFSLDCREGTQNNDMIHSLSKYMLGDSQSWYMATPQ